MIGAIYGDIIGSVYEHNATKSEDFALLSAGSTFTDDTALTVAVAEALLYRADHPQDSTAPDALYAARYRQYYARYPDAGYGGMFIQWAQRRDAARNNSYGNGAAMRVSPIGYAFDEIEQVLREARPAAPSRTTIRTPWPALRRSPRAFILRVRGRPNRRSRRSSNAALGMTCPSHWKASAVHTGSRYKPANACRNVSLHFWNPTIMKARYAR